MSSAIPPAPPPAAPPPAASAPPVLSVTAESTAAAQALAKLQAGAMVAATLLSADGKGNVQVMTADGAALSLRLPPGQAVPPNGAQLAMQYISQNGLPAFKLLAINGRPATALPPPPNAFAALPNLPDPAAMLGPGGGGARPAGPPPGPGGAAVITAPGAAAGPLGLTATMIRSGPPGAVMMAGGDGNPALAMTGKIPDSLLGLPPGTQLTVRIAAITPPPQGAAGPGQPIPASPTAFPPAAQPQPGQIPAAAQPGAALQANGQPAPPQPGPAALAHSPALAPPGTAAAPQGPPTPQATMPGSATPAALPSSAPATTLPGLVLSQPPGAGALVQSPIGTLSLNVAAPLPVGGIVRLEIVDRPLPPPAPPAAAAPQGLSGDGWPALDQSVDTLLANDRQAAEQLMRMIPQAGPRLAAAMSLFAGAVRSGDFAKLAGEPVIKGLERAGRKDLAERLKKDFAELSDQSSRPVGRGDWQAITLPFAHGSHIDPINLYVHRHQDDEEGGGKAGSEQRFILDLRMSVLGRIQLDGLVQRDTKRFDLIVRTGEALPNAMCRDIAGIFAECGLMTGIKGQVSFQAGRPFVELPPATPPATQIVV